MRKRAKQRWKGALEALVTTNIKVFSRDKFIKIKKRPKRLGCGAEGNEGFVMKSDM